MPATSTTERSRKSAPPLRRPRKTARARKLAKPASRKRLTVATITAGAPWHKSRPVALRATATVHDAIAAIAAACRDHWDANLAAAVAGHHPEGVHQFRVGLRRFRLGVEAEMGEFHQQWPRQPRRHDDHGFTRRQPVCGVERAHHGLGRFEVAQVEFVVNHAGIAASAMPCRR